MPDVEASETSPLLSPTSTLSPDAIFPDHPDRSFEHDTIPETATYGRNLSWTSAYILVISRVIGSGIFATPGAIVKSVGSIGLALSLWVAGTILSACGMAVSLEYGCMLPRSGGDKVYLEFTYRYPKFLASTLIAVQAVLLGFTASNCIIFSKYLSFAFSIEPTEFQSKALALGLLTIITIIHGRFMKAGIAIQNALGWVKIFLILFMALSGVYVILFHERGETVTSFASSDAGLWEELWKDSDWSWNNLSTSLFKVFYSYAGLNNMNNVLNEVKNPVRTLKTVCPAALITACLLYLLANVSYFLVVPIEEIKESGELVAALFFERAFGPHFGRTVLPLMIAISAVGNVMVVTFALVSEIYNMFADILSD
jgi:amino acid transporter